MHTFRKLILTSIPSSFKINKKLKIYIFGGYPTTQNYFFFLSFLSQAFALRLAKSNCANPNRRFKVGRQQMALITLRAKIKKNSEDAVK